MAQTADIARPWSFATAPAMALVGDLPTAYRRAGAGPTTLYLHGLALTRRWLPFHDALSRHLDVIAPELPGFGDTPLPDWLGSMSDVVLHLDSFLDVLGVGAVHLVGHSLGGWAAADFAITYPKRVRSLTLINAMGVRAGEPVTDVFRITASEQDHYFYNDRAAELGAYLEGGDIVDDLILAFRELTAAARVAFNPRYDHRFERRLCRVNCPALVVGAADDRVVPSSHAHRYGELLPCGSVTILEPDAGTPAGHLPMVHRPTATADLVSSFIAAQEGAS